MNSKICGLLVSILTLSAAFGQDAPPTVRNFLLVISNDANRADAVFKANALTANKLSEPPVGWVLRKKGELCVLIDGQLVESPLGQAHLISQQLLAGKKESHVLELDELPHGYRDSLAYVMIQCGMGARSMRAFLRSEKPKVGISPVVVFDVESGGKTVRVGVTCEPDGFKKQVVSAGISTLDLQREITSNPGRYDGDEVDRKVTAERQLHVRFQAISHVDEMFDDSLKFGMDSLLKLREEYRSTIEKRWNEITLAMLEGMGYALPKGDTKLADLDSKVADALSREFISRREWNGFGSLDEANSFLRGAKIWVARTDLTMTISRYMESGSDGLHSQRTIIRF